MSAPKRERTEDPDFKVEETLHTESVFTDKNLEDIVAFLKREKCSGKLFIDMNKGGVTRVAFCQKQPVDVDY
jgi:hypothetical protein